MLQKNFDITLEDGFFGKIVDSFMRSRFHDFLVGGPSQREIRMFLMIIANAAGIRGGSMANTLDLAIKSTKNKGWRVALEKMKEAQAKHQYRWYELFGMYPQYFSKSLIATVKDSESRGNLKQDVRDWLSDRAEEEENKIKQKQETSEVKMTGFFAIAVVLVFTFFIGPKIMSSFTQMGIDMPGLTLYLMAIMKWLTQHSVQIFIAAIVFFTAFELSQKAHKGRVYWGYFLLFQRIPLLSFMSRWNNTRSVKMISRSIMKKAIGGGRQLDFELIKKVASEMENQALIDYLDAAARRLAVDKCTLAEALYYRSEDEEGIMDPQKLRDPYRFLPAYVIGMYMTGWQQNKAEASESAFEIADSEYKTENATFATGLAMRVKLIVMGCIGVILLAMMLPMVQQALQVGKMLPKF